MTFTINKSSVGLVLSAVIGWLIQHLLDYITLFEKLTMYIDESRISEWLKSLFHPSYSFFDIFIVIIIASSFYLLVYKNIVRIFFSSKEKMDKARKEIKSFDNLIFEESAIHFKWEVTFNQWHKPVMVNLRPYCLWHEPPIPMIHAQSSQGYQCPLNHHDVKPYLSMNDYSQHEIQIQAHIENKWKELTA